MPSRPLNNPRPDSALGTDVEARHRCILSLASMLIYSRAPDEDHRYTSVCGNTQAALGWDSNLLVADPDFWRTSLHPEDAPRVLAILKSLPERGECSEEYRLRSHSGVYVWFMDKMTLIKNDDGAPIEIVGCLLDITRTKELERKLREALLTANAASQAKSDFLSNMSHELRTPLNSVIGFSEVLLDRFFGPLTDKQEEYVTTIRESGQRLLAQLTDILQLTKLDAGDIALELAPASPAGLLRASLEMSKEKASLHSISLELDLAGDMEQAMLLDEVKFRQVLVALLGNAVKFTQDKGRVKVSGRRFTTTEGESLEVRIEDSGPGFPAEFLSRLFTPFTQMERPHTKKHSGVGLGLALARRLARLQGGEVELAGTSDQGSCLVFTLPMPNAVRATTDTGREPPFTNQT